MNIERGEIVIQAPGPDRPRWTQWNVSVRTHRSALHDRDVADDRLPGVGPVIARARRGQHAGGARVHTSGIHGPNPRAAPFEAGRN